MDNVTAAILEFACRWLPYGGPPADEIWIGFGMTAPRYEQRLAKILDTAAGREVPPDIRDRLCAQLSERRRRRALRSAGRV
ncbi:DUF3263 domain-containing protein [Rhodococcus opacus]|uniref:DUF3263 domain-containing protein n=1 Tax=Rhodococcus opacus TaxID=37919 RepID=UPI000AA63DBE